MSRKDRNRTEKVTGVQPLRSSFDEQFPTIARWILQEGGWVEVGADHHSRSLVRALNGGGMVWEGTENYQSLDQALRAMEEGIALWLEETRPAIGNDENAKNKPSRTPSGRSSIRKSTPARVPATPTKEKRVKSDASPVVPRVVVEKIRKFADIAEALRRGQQFEITRLTGLKGLCKDQDAARSFALFLAVHARKKADEKEATEQVKGLMDRAILEMESYPDDPTKERKDRLHDLLREIEKEQDEYRRISFGQVRIVHCMELIVFEKALKSIIRDVEAPIWLYRAARDYAERYDSRYGTGLIPASAPMMREIADFWQDYFGIVTRGEMP